MPGMPYENSSIKLRVPDRFSAEDETPFVLVECRKCGLLYLNPRPIEEQSGAFMRMMLTTFISAKTEKHIRPALRSHPQTQ